MDRYLRNHGIGGDDGKFLRIEKDLERRRKEVWWTGYITDMTTCLTCSECEAQDYADGTSTSEESEDESSSEEESE